MKEGKGGVGQRRRERDSVKDKRTNSPWLVLNPWSKTTNQIASYFGLDVSGRFLALFS